MSLQNFALPMLALSRWAKRFVVLVLDTALCVLTVWSAYHFRLDEFLVLSENHPSALAGLSARQ